MIALPTSTGKTMLGALCLLAGAKGQTGARCLRHAVGRNRTAGRGQSASDSHLARREY